MKRMTVLASAAVVGLAAINAQAGVISFGFDSATVGPQTVLALPGVPNTTDVSQTFDTTIKSEGSASLWLTGTTSASFGYFSPTIDIGALSATGTVDLSQPNTVLNFALRTANSSNIDTAANMQFRFYSGGTLASPDLMATRFWDGAKDDNAAGAFSSRTQVIKNVNGTNGPSWVNEAYTGDLTAVKYVRIYYGWDGSVSGRSLDVHLDDFQISGPGVTPVPEPSAMAAAGLVSLAALGRRRRRSS